MMIAAQSVRHSRPRRVPELVRHRARNGELSLLVDREAGSLGENGQQAVGVLGLDPGLNLHAQERSQIIVGEAFEQLGLPAEPRRRHSEAADRVTGVVVAITEGPLAVLPRFAPVNGRQAHQERSLRELCRDLPPCFTRQLHPELERVRERRVVVDRRPRMKPGDGSGDQVPFSRVKIAARRIDPKRPTGAPRLLPGGEGEGILKELGDRGTVQRAWSDMTKREDGLIARLRPQRQEIERQYRGAFESAERIGLRVPVQVTESSRKAKRMVFRALVVRQSDVQRRGRLRLLVAIQGSARFRISRSGHPAPPHGFDLAATGSRSPAARSQVVWTTTYTSTSTSPPATRTL
jgi:hypothetical protein